MPELGQHILHVPGSGIRRIHELALTMSDGSLEGITMLAVGEPDLPVAGHIAAAATAAWEADETNYTANGGIPALRSAIAARHERQHGAPIATERIWVTVGGTQALHQAMGLVLAPGDEILVPDPGYTTFSMSPRMLSAVPVPYPLRVETGFQPEPERIESLITPRTRAIIVNSPSNPLGTVLDPAGANAMLDLAERHDLWIISDEVYESLAWTGPHVSLAALDSAATDGRGDRVLGVFSTSKTYAMTGVRVGWLTVPAGLTDTMRTVQEAMISCVSTPDQFAAVAALDGPQDALVAAREHYRGNLDAASALLAGRGIRHLVPGGAFYLWIDVSHASAGDVAAWAERFLLEHRVAVAPGSAFGASGEGWIRVCAAATRADLMHGLALIPAP
jgi:aspartate aminotransferase